MVESISGQLINGGYETVAANGTETGTNSDETVVFVAGDCFDLEGQTITLTIDFTQPINATDLGEVPFNAFLIANQDRAKEVHLPDLPPTSKAGLLGTQDDFSDPAMGQILQNQYQFTLGIEYL